VTARLLRELTPRVLATIVRRYRNFAGCEDAVQEALVAAAQQWPTTGVPENPLGWLIRVATRRVTDELRSIAARRVREHLVVSLIPADEQIALAADRLEPERDDTLDLFWMCCHPALSTSSQVALTLRAVGGLTTAEIARAFLVPETTMAQRLSRAKQTIKDSAIELARPTDADRAARLGAVLQVLYLIFNEGYTATSGETLQRIDLSSEAIRVVRMLAGSIPATAEIEGLLALMLLTDARRDARSGPNDELIPLDEQDRARWNRTAIDEGNALLASALGRGTPGPYQVQAAIAALHDEAASTETTDWAQIAALYDVLIAMTDSPMARLSRAIARAMVEGPAAGLAEIEDLARDPRIGGNYRLAAARGHLHERAGDLAAAVTNYRRAADATTSTPERNYLLLKAARLDEA
jgi:RNA polymerase sigma factor (sigma-70 family)